MKLLHFSKGELETEIGFLGIDSGRKFNFEKIYNWVVLLYFPTKIGKVDGVTFDIRGYLGMWIDKLIGW